MLKKLFIICFITITSFISAQTSIEKELEIIESTDQIKNYLESKNSNKNKLITFNEEKHKTLLAKELFKLHVGGTKSSETEFENTYYKIINKTNNPYYRVSYIYLDGSKYDLKNINALRNRIILKYNNGTPFDFLAKQYSMDENANKGGDLGWFSTGEMHPDFENIIINENHNINDIFTIDIPSKKWYYVVLKTFEPKEILEVEVLKIVETKD